MPEASPQAVCVICQSPLLQGEKLVRCKSCRTIYHAECWQEAGGCGVYGCPQVPKTEGRDALEIPAAHWGQENKACPACGALILAAAVRCRHCGATFASANPEDRQKFLSRQQIGKQAPQVRKRIIWLFVCACIPCLAPLAALFGSLWYAAHRSEIQALPAVYTGLAKIGLGIAIGQTAAGIVMAILFSLVRGG